MKTKEKLLAKCRGASIRIEDHGWIYLHADFEYDDGCSVQGLPVYMMDGAFVMRFMVALGIDDLSNAAGKSCWLVKGESGYIEEIHPLHKKNGTPFIIPEWQKWIKTRGIGVSASEMRTGVKPR